MILKAKSPTDVKASNRSMMADLKLTRKREVSHNRQNTTHFNNVALEMPKIPMTTVKQPPTPTRTESRPDLGIFQFFKDWLVPDQETPLAFQRGS